MNEINYREHIAAIILSGGRGSRLGGIDKGLQLLDDKQLIEHVINAIQPYVDTVVISINRNQHEYEKLNYLTVRDEATGSFNGPLAGILSTSTVLKNKSFKYYLVSTCDCPLLPNNYTEKLLSEIGTANVAVVNDGKRRQNLHCLIKTSAISSLQQFYNEGGRAMHHWLRKINAVDVDFSAQAKCFKNINTREQLGDN